MKMVKRTVLILAVLVFLSLTASLSVLAESRTDDTLSQNTAEYVMKSKPEKEEKDNGVLRAILFMLLGSALTCGGFGIVYSIRTGKSKSGSGNNKAQGQDPFFTNGAYPDPSSVSTSPYEEYQEECDDTQGEFSGEANIQDGISSNAAASQGGDSLMGETVPLNRKNDAAATSNMDETVPLNAAALQHRKICIFGLGGFFDRQRIEQDDLIIIGRDQARCTLRFPEDTAGISWLHCCLTWKGMDLEITDLGSSFGTFVNGVKLKPNVQTVLRPGDSFYLADKMHSFLVQ